MIHHIESKLSLYIPAVFILVAVLFAVSSIMSDSQIVDEIPHVGAGYSYLVKQDMRLNPEHPPLAKDLAAIPLLFMNLKQTIFESRHWTSNLNDQWEFGRQFIYNSGNDADKIKLFSRLPMLLFYILAAILIFKWGTELYGEVAGLLALLLFLFSSTVMGHTRFVTTDVPALFGVLSTIYFFLKYLQKQTRGHLILSGVFLGIALLLKFNTVLLAPFLLVVAVGYALIFDNHRHHTLRHVLRYLGTTLIIFAIAGTVVWIVYLFHTLNYPPERQLSDTKALLTSFGNKTLAEPVIWMADKPVIRALGQYFLGFLMVVQRSAGGNTIYFLGEVKNQGGPFYFPLVYFLKEPIAWWILVFVAGTAMIYRSVHTKHSASKSLQWLRRHFPEVVMVAWLAFYWFISIRSTLNIGLRHMLPTYPFAILLIVGQITKIADWLRHEREKEFIKWFSLGVAVMLGWYVFENLRVYPYYLTYFNQFAGGPAGGHRYVTDSNLDWGQDLKRLGRFVEEQGIKKIDLDYFGWADQKVYLENGFNWVSADTYRDARDFMQRNNSNGWIAISATFFQQASSPNADHPTQPLKYLWLKSYEPVAVIGNSIFVWHITR